MSKPVIPTLSITLTVPTDILKSYSDSYINEYYDELPKQATVLIGHSLRQEYIIRESEFSRDFFIFKVEKMFKKYNGFSTPHKDKVRKFCQQYGITCPRLYTPEEATKCVNDYLGKKFKEGKAVKCRPFSYVGDSILGHFNMQEVFKLLKQNYPKSKYSYGFSELLPSGEYAVDLLCYETGLHVLFTLSELHNLYGDIVDETGKSLIDINHFYDENGVFKLGDAYQETYCPKNRSRDDDDIER